MGMALAHHGLVVWGDDAEECYGRLVEVTGRIDDYLTTKTPTRPAIRPPDSRMPGPSAGPFDDRRRRAELVLPVVRGTLGKPERVILHYDADEDLLATLEADGVSDLVGRGMATPEHLLRAGRLPVWLALDPNASGDEMAE